MPRGSSTGQNTTSIARRNKQKKGARKKSADPFFKKEWYVIKVPTYMPTSGNKWRVGYSPATKGKGRKALDNRTFVINMRDLEDKPEEQTKDDITWKKFSFVTQEVFGDKLLTQWNGMEITRDKRCSLIRKWHTMIQAICDAKTTDGYVLRVKVIAFTKRQVTQVKKNCYAKNSQVLRYIIFTFLLQIYGVANARVVPCARSANHCIFLLFIHSFSVFIHFSVFIDFYFLHLKIRQIRASMRDIVRGHISSTDLKGVVKRLSESTIGQDIRKQCQLIFPIKICLVEKVKVLKKPKKDSAKIMSLHDLKTGYDVVEEGDEYDEDEDEDDEEDGDDDEEMQ